MKKLGYWIVRIMAKLFPRGKRLVAISILLPKIRGTREIDIQTLKSINESLSLCVSEETLVFPMKVTEHVLDEQISALIETELSEQDYIESVYKLLPVWARYSHKRFVKDIEILQTFRASNQLIA